MMNALSVCGSGRSSCPFLATTTRNVPPGARASSPLPDHCGVSGVVRREKQARQQECVVGSASSLCTTRLAHLGFAHRDERLRGVRVPLHETNVKHPPPFQPDLLGRAEDANGGDRARVVWVTLEDVRQTVVLLRLARLETSLNDHRRRPGVLVGISPDDVSEGGETLRGDREGHDGGVGVRVRGVREGLDGRFDRGREGREKVRDRLERRVGVAVGVDVAGVGLILVRVSVRVLGRKSRRRSRGGLERVRRHLHVTVWRDRGDILAVEEQSWVSNLLRGVSVY